MLRKFLLTPITFGNILALTILLCYGNVNAGVKEEGTGSFLKDCKQRLDSNYKKVLTKSEAKGKFLIYYASTSPTGCSDTFAIVSEDVLEHHESVYKDCKKRAYKYTKTDCYL